ncbi:uncharacterized protein [Dermacentor andersoni]|uniref:uncharacterized protein n=1 Tax=Dermacentor andersoni TaxID=34620 RepID=UPI002417800A|nr:uncharacterized protein LOC129384251 [Dermacentor andersoni]
MYCYKYVFISGAPDGQEGLIGKKRMIRNEQLVDFQVTDVNGLRSIDIKKINHRVPTEDTPKEFPHTYLVLRADKECLLVSYGVTDDDCQKCLLWGLSGSNVSNETECYQASKLYCTDNLYDMTETENPCLHFDHDEARRDQKAQEEEELSEHRA